MAINSKKYDVIVIGGGASGMMSAGQASKRGKKVLLLEKNKSLGEKLKITGGGRCNITNGESDIRKFLSNYGQMEPFLYSPFSQFGIKDTFTFFENLGLPLVIQERNRVFPITEKALDVCSILIKYLTDNSVEIITDCEVNKLNMIDNNISSVLTSKGEYFAENIILSTGGFSHPETGSTGDGFTWLKDIGHNTKEPTPNIVPISVSDKWIKDLSGKVIENIKITFFVNINGKKIKKFSKPNKKDDSKIGKLLCTHFGLSGPLVLNSSKQIFDLFYEGLVTAEIDCYPEKNIGELEKYILSIFDQNKNKLLKNVFTEIAPKGCSSVILTLLPHINPLTKINELKKENRKELVHLLKSLPLTITGLMGFDKAVVADGGLDINEIDTKTMKSKKIKNLFVTGDILNIERPSGGFSLQLCWTTGFVAGNNV